MSTQDNDGRGAHGTRRKLVTGASAVVALALIGAGVFYATGGYDDWRADRSLDRACDGLLDTSELKALLGADRLHSQGADPAHCSVSDPGDGRAALRVEITRGAAPARLLGTLRRNNPHLGGTLMSPVGNGRPAILKTGTSTAAASGALACGPGESDSLTVVMTAVRDGSGKAFDRPEQRARLARALTGTLDRTAEQWHCTGKTAGSGPITAVPGDTTRTLKAAGRATGTCAGIGSPVYEAAADGPAPVEDCVLADASGTRLFQLSAYYGPFAKAARLETVRGKQILTEAGGADGLYWTTSACEDGGAALFSVEPLFDEETKAFHPADPKLQQAALQTFAENSAQRHGCPSPRPLPAG
ncbi:MULTISPECIES: hypothetical protein [unclassified Streptomyces]|uniref:hypothetical protein n=1 Tax=unclassified Streptomyces TaxID=2593676 RepID=UPI0035DCC4A9